MSPRPLQPAAITTRHDVQVRQFRGQHITKVSCPGKLSATFTQADGSCLSYREMSRYEHYEEETDSYVCLFHSASRDPIHVLRQPEDFDPVYDRMRSSYSPCSSYLMVYWSPDSLDKLNVACLSRAECTQRMVGPPCQSQGATAACTHQLHAHSVKVLAKCTPFAFAAPGPAVPQLYVMCEWCSHAMVPLLHLPRQQCLTCELCSLRPMAATGCPCLGPTGVPAADGVPCSGLDPSAASCF